MRLVTTAGEVHPVRLGRNIIGRASDADIVLTDEMISRRHAKLLWNGSECILVDLGSANGTFVDGRRLIPYQPQSVSPSNLLRFGSEFTLSLRMDAGADHAPPVSPSIPVSPAETSQRTWFRGWRYRKLGFAFLVLVVTGGVLVLAAWILSLLLPGVGLFYFLVALIGLTLLVLFCVRFWNEIKQGFRQGWRSVMKE